MSDFYRRFPDTDSHDDPHRNLRPEPQPSHAAAREYRQQPIARPWSAVSGNGRNTAHLCAVAGMARQHHQDRQIHAAAEEAGREDISQGARVRTPDAAERQTRRRTRPQRFAGAAYADIRLPQLRNRAARSGD